MSLPECPQNIPHSACLKGAHDICNLLHSPQHAHTWFFYPSQVLSIQNILYCFSVNLPASQPPLNHVSNFNQLLARNLVTLYLKYTIVLRIKSRLLSKTNKVLHGLATAGLRLSSFPLTPFLLHWYYHLLASNPFYHLHLPPLSSRSVFFCFFCYKIFRNFLRSAWVCNYAFPNVNVLISIFLA